MTLPLDSAKEQVVLKFKEQYLFFSVFCIFSKGTKPRPLVDLHFLEKTHI